MFALLNHDKMTLVGKFESIEAAERIAKNAKYDYGIVGKADELNSYSGPDLLKLHNALTGSELKKFETKASAISRTWEAIVAAEVKTVNPPKSGKASTGRSTALVDERELETKVYEKKRWKNGTARSQINAFIEKKGKTTVGAVVAWALKEGVCENRQQVIGCINKLASHPKFATVVVL